MYEIQIVNVITYQVYVSIRGLLTTIADSDPANVIQQGLEIHGLEECGPWRYTVFNWFPKHLRYTDFGQKP